MISRVAVLVLIVTGGFGCGLPPLPAVENPALTAGDRDVLRITIESLARDRLMASTARAKKDRALVMSPTRLIPLSRDSGGPPRFRRRPFLSVARARTRVRFHRFQALMKSDWHRPRSLHGVRGTGAPASFPFGRCWFRDRSGGRSERVSRHRRPDSSGLPCADLRSRLRRVSLWRNMWRRIVRPVDLHPDRLGREQSRAIVD